MFGNAQGPHVYSVSQKKKRNSLSEIAETVSANRARLTEQLNQGQSVDGDDLLVLAKESARKRMAIAAAKRQPKRQRVLDLSWCECRRGRPVAIEFRRWRVARCQGVSS